MSTVRGRTVGFLALTFLVVSLAWWGCGGSKTDETATPPGDKTSTSSGTATGGGGEVSLAVGGEVFKESCEMCHGPGGKGDGPAGQALNPKPRNMTDAAYMKGLTDDYIRQTILNGKAGTGMPPHKDLLTPEQVESVILKVRSFSQPS